MASGASRIILFSKQTGLHEFQARELTALSLPTARPAPPRHRPARGQEPIRLSMGEPQHAAPDFRFGSPAVASRRAVALPGDQGFGRAAPGHHRLGHAPVSSEQDRARSGAARAARRRHARGAVLDRPGRHRPAREFAAPFRGHAESVLPDLRRRDAAGRRAAVFPERRRGQRLPHRLRRRAG